MKLNIQFKLAFLFLFLPAVAFAIARPDDVKTTKERSIKKSFNVSSDATLKVNNSYGNLNVITWDENRIEFDITIKVTGNNAEKVQERLDNIDVEFSSTRSLVSAITKIEKNKKNWWNWTRNSAMQLQINYVIKMPKTNNVDLTNDYGFINLDTLEGHAKLSCDYGKITTKELLAENNSINFDYGSKCYFEYIKSGKIRADYSGFTVAKASNLIINTDYTNSVIEVAENVQYHCDYGSLKIDNVNNLEGDGDYLTLRLGNVFKNVSIKANYGSIKIDRMASKAKNIDINSDYVGITIGYDANYNFDFTINLDYGSLKATDNFNFTTKNVDDSDKHYSGYHGTKNSGNTVKINSNYGSISFSKI